MEQVKELQSSTKCTALQCYFTLRSLLESHSVDCKDTFVILNNYYDTIISNKPYNAYHYKLLRTMLRQFLYPTRDKLEKLVVLLNIELAHVRAHPSLYLQSEYLRLVRSVVKSGPRRLNMIMPNILDWLRHNQCSVVEKHLLNIVRDLDVTVYTDNNAEQIEKHCFDLVHMFHLKGYYEILLSDEADYFISKTSAVSQQHQSVVIETVLVLTEVLLEQDLNQTFVEEYITPLCVQGEAISRYIFSVLRDSDTALFNCLTLMLRIYQRVTEISDLSDVKCVVDIIESKCFSPLVWFMKVNFKQFSSFTDLYGKLQLFSTHLTL